ncbi:MAG: hypothetical protein JW725_03245 [Candidatus Babeliaceae bacterium]|nr:hypothetical protein [Candidatus Babeliaceae bacterium]
MNTILYCCKKTVLSLSIFLGLLCPVAPVGAMGNLLSTGESSRKVGVSPLAIPKMEKPSLWQHWGPTLVQSSVRFLVTGALVVGTVVAWNQFWDRRCEGLCSRFFDEFKKDFKCGDGDIGFFDKEKIKRYFYDELSIYDEMTSYAVTSAVEKLKKNFPCYMLPKHSQTGEPLLVNLAKKGGNIATLMEALSEADRKKWVNAYWDVRGFTETPFTALLTCVASSSYPIDNYLNNVEALLPFVDFTLKVGKALDSSKLPEGFDAAKASYLDYYILKCKEGESTPWKFVVDKLIEKKQTCEQVKNALLNGWCLNDDDFHNSLKSVLPNFSDSNPNK